jgi:hypothetical protein
MVAKCFPSVDSFITKSRLISGAEALWGEFFSGFRIGHFSGVFRFLSHPVPH